MSFGMPPLQSKLALWAQAVVDAGAWLQESQEDDDLSQDLDNMEVDDDMDDWEEEPSETVYCIGMPPLQSTVGRWAEAVVNAGAWLEKEAAGCAVLQAKARAESLGSDLARQCAMEVMMEHLGLEAEGLESELGIAAAAEVFQADDLN